jgi:CRISPR/Cas system CMR-associated protein Cmr1 (group 7 of RAMP superfamily)
MIDAHQITRSQDQATLEWHDHASHFFAEQPSGAGDSPESNIIPVHVPVEGIMRCILAQHRANFDLWHQEDLARDMRATAENIADVKHAIDRLNQNRNDLVEKIDETLLNALPHQVSTAPLNSEPPGLIIDRLSILALKIYHTREEAQRESATTEHRFRNLDRLRVLEEQRTDLADCLDVLWKQVLAGERRFKLYRQMKMYNDPQLNPVLYGQQGPTKGC